MDLILIIILGSLNFKLQNLGFLDHSFKGIFTLKFYISIEFLQVYKFFHHTWEVKSQEYTCDYAV